MNAMWKPNQPGTNPTTPSDPIRPQTPTPLNSEPAAPRPAPTPSAASSEQATIGKSLTIKGEITGSEMLYIDGHVEGSVSLPGNRVVIGRNGHVGANISAREVVILGKVNGNINATDRVDIRNEGSLTGDVVAQRISIEDGAYFKGGIDIRKPGNKEAEAAKTNSAAVAAPAHV
jgi:cytoskeletal protein CcmA (bactofilin family)